MNDTLAQVLCAGALPALLGGCAVLVHARSGWRRAAATALLAGAPIACQILLEGRPAERWHAVVGLPAGAFLAFLVASMMPSSRWSAALLALMLALTALIVQLRITTPEDGALLRWGPVAAAAMLASIGATRKEGRLDGIVLALALGSATGMALVAGFLRLAVIIGATGCALGVAGLALQLRKRRETHASFGLAIIGIPSLAVGPMVARAYVVDDALPSGAFLIPALIPVLALGAGAIMPGRSPRVRGAIVILSSIVCAAALPLIVHGSSSNSESGDPYEQMYNEMMPSGEGNE